MSSRKHIRIGFAGLGTVGQGVWKHLMARKDDLETRLNARIDLVGAAVGDLSKKRGVRIAKSKLSEDAVALAKDPNVDILCELMGGTTLAREVTETALKSGKIVVTANKALLCDHGQSLFQIALENGGHLYYEASVAGGIPIIKALREGLVINRFPLIYGILNGTCNYILTRMEREGKPFEDIVEDARRLGYVEADESLDLDGYDAAHKAVIITYLAHGKWIPLNKISVEGIRGVSLQDIRWAKKLGYKLKLLAVILRDFEHNHVYTTVQPALVPKDMVLANVDDVFNAVSVTGDVVGESVYIGRGAGQDATASAVISDIVDASQSLINEVEPTKIPENPSLELADLNEVYRAFYLRLHVKDQPGVLADTAQILADHAISIESVLQKPNGKSGTAHLVLTTHVTSEAAMAQAIAVLKKEKSVLRKPFLLRIADFSQSIH